MENKVCVVVDVCDRTIIGVYKNSIIAQEHIDKMENLYGIGWRLQIQAYTIQE